MSHHSVRRGLGSLAVCAGALVALAPVPARAQGAAAAKADSAAKKKDLPLTPTRKIAFTTSKGSWISVDVSPDGQLLVFDLLGDLYTLPITGGKATRLTSGMAMDVQPRFSPDGKRIAFVSDRSGGENVWVMSLDGTDTTQVTKGNNNLYISPEWTPDGKYVVATKSGGLGSAGKLWMYNVDGGTGVQLVREPAPMKTLGAAFGPDPRYVWYAVRQGDWQYNAALPQFQLAVYDRETGSQTIMSSRYGSAFRPALSPDGKWLVYGSRHETDTGLRIRDLATGEESWLILPIQRDDQESTAPMDVIPGYSFTPDSRALVTFRDGELWRVPLDRSAPTKIAMSVDVALDAGPEVRFVNRVDTKASFTAHQIRDAVPSPDGKRLAFTSLDKVYVMDYPGGTPRRLSDLTVNEHYPAWSPDGKSVAWVTWDDKTGGHLYKARVDADPKAKAAPKAQRLTKVAALYSEIAWSSDGRRIVADRGAARDMQEAIGFFEQLGSQFVWVGADGGDVTVIAPSAGRGHLHFVQGDTTRLYAYGPRDGLVSFRWDGTDVRPIVKVTGPMPPGAMYQDLDAAIMTPRTFLDELEPQMPQAPPASLVIMAPKGDRALAQVGSHLYVLSVPVVGGPTPTVSVAAPETAPVPVRKLTDIGAQFPAWGADGRTVHWSIGNAHVVYDLDRAKVVEDSLKKVARAKADSASAHPRAAADSARAVAAGHDSASAKPGYHPVEHRIAIAVTRDIPQASAVLRGGRVITMKGAEVIEDADIVVRNDRIVAVGKRGSVEVPPGAEIIDVSGQTITPGFVDTHYHPQWLIPDVHSNQVWQYLPTLAYGTTTTRDPQTSTTDVLTYEDKVESGEMIGPRVYSTGPGVFSGEMIRDLDHARSILKRYAQYYDTKTLKMYMTGNRQQRQWVIMAAKELGLMPTTEGGLDFKLNMTHVLDGYSGMEHAIPITPLFDDVLTIYAKTGITYTPTLIVSYGGPFGENYWYTHENIHDDPKVRHFTPESDLDAKTRRRGMGTGGSPGPAGWFRDEEYVFSRHAAFVKELLAQGGRAGIGSHGQFQGLGYHWELWMMATGGMSNHEVLRMATILGAEAIGMGDDLGSIEPGKMADLVVMTKNPLENIRNTNSIHYVMKNGRLYEGETLDEVYPRKRKLPTFVWQGGDGPTRGAVR
jgi:Tol biopolymer transport system component